MEGIGWWGPLWRFGASAPCSRRVAGSAGRVWRPRAEGPLHEPAPGPGVGPVGVRGPGPADGLPGVLGQGLEFGPDLGYQPPLLSSAVGARATSSSISRSGYISDKFPFNPKVLSENGSNIKATVVRLTPEDAHNILSLRNFQRHRRIVQGAAP